MSYQVVGTILVTLLGVGLGAGLLAYELWFKRPEKPLRDDSYNYPYSTTDNETFRRLDRNDFEDECIICCDKLGARRKKLRCGHVYHLKCISEWFKRDSQHRCPICRKRIIIV